MGKATHYSFKNFGRIILWYSQPRITPSSFHYTLSNCNSYIKHVALAKGWERWHLSSCDKPFPAPGMATPKSGARLPRAQCREGRREQGQARASKGKQGRAPVLLSWGGVSGVIPAAALPSPGPGELWSVREHPLRPAPSDQRSFRMS